MSRQVRHRVTAVVLGGLLLGTPLLTNGTANAEQTVAAEAGARQVVFAGGGVLGLSCRATPDVGSLTVPAESTVRVVNRTGHSAQLRLGGTTKGTIPDDGSTEVVFRRGTTAVLLSPNCALGKESTPVLVTATPSAPPSGLPNPIPVPSEDDDDAKPAAPDDSDSPATPSDGTAQPGTGTPTRTRTTTPGVAGKPSTTRPNTLRPDTRAATQAATTAAQGMPQGGSTSKVRTRVTRGTGTGGPTFAGMPPGDQKAIVSGVPTLDLPPPVEPAPAAPAASASDIAAAEPVAAMEPLSEDGPIGLLAAVAIVCVLGVAAGAIRAIVSQRASRTSTA